MLAQANDQYLSTGAAIAVLVLAGFFLIVVGFGLMALIAYGKGLAGLIREYESVVINRGGRFRADKEVNPEGRDAANSRTMLGLLFYRWPLFTWGVRVSRKWTEFDMPNGEIPMEGFEVEYGIVGKFRIAKAHPFVETMDLDGPAGQQALEEIALNNALRILRQVSADQLLQSVGSIDQVRRPPIGFLERILPILNEAGEKIGIEYTDLGWGTWGVPPELSRALASPSIAEALSQGMVARGATVEREIDAFMDAARREAGQAASEGEVRTIARRMWSVAAATTNGSADLPVE